ncbi:MAG: hypothetical protein EOO16_08295 [Chitinophagaceae bacterium]|nr:MAG: hypothetical protein EOO16_08295 [Chitinophagaceae bacterium]
MRLRLPHKKGAGYGAGMHFPLLQRTAVAWAALLALFLPLPPRLLSGQELLAPTLFGPVVKLFGFAPATLLRSDAPALWLLAALLAIPAVAIAAGMGRLALPSLSNAKRLLSLLLTFYLAALLLRYGADKLTGGQFYRPEPNTLYTPFGALDPDILYWSVMGLSRPYQVFLGGVEVLAALLLFFRRTRTAGLWLAFLVCAQILSVNWCFGIAVKLLSSFLLLLSAGLIGRDWMRMARLLGGKAVAALPARDARGGPLRITLKVLAGGLLLADAFYPAIASGHWNDSAGTRPYLYGAWEVTPAPARFFPGDTVPVRRLFFHRDHYLVLQDVRDGLRSFPVVADSLSGSLRLRTGPEAWQRIKLRTTAPGELYLDAPAGALLLRALPWRQLPALRAVP